MDYFFHPEAERELEEAVAWYEEHAPGLGLDFASEVQEAVRRALAMPQAWEALDGDIRRILVNRFPYGVLYAHGKAGIFIVAIMHLRRQPGYWKLRVV